MTGRAASIACAAMVASLASCARSPRSLLVVEIAAPAPGVSLAKIRLQVAGIERLESGEVPQQIGVYLPATFAGEVTAVAEGLDADGVPVARGTSEPVRISPGQTRHATVTLSRVSGGRPAGDAGPGEERDAGTGKDTRPAAGDSGQASPSWPAEQNACLPPDEEKLEIKIRRGIEVPLYIKAPYRVRCDSQVHPAKDGEKPLIDLIWNGETPPLSILVRTEGITPGTLGTFEPFAVAISSSGTWIGSSCRVTFTTSEKIADEVYNTLLSGEVFKVAASVTCGRLDGPGTGSSTTDVLELFEFVSRTTLLHHR